MYTSILRRHSYQKNYVKLSNIDVNGEEICMTL
jgi:hypothetical protein